MSRKISGLLIDIDGTLITGNSRIEGARETLEWLSNKNIPFILMTNTTRRSRITIWHQLQRLGFRIPETSILTAPLAAIQYLKKHQVEKIHLMLSGSAVNDFKDLKITTAEAEYVVVGDLGKDLTFERLNTAFRLIMKGSKILALQKNRFWQTEDGPTIDAGAIVAALEFASGKKARLIGKPQKEFFKTAADYLGLPLKKIAVIGDDLDADVAGAKKAGMLGIAVKTGKFTNYSAKDIEKAAPDFILDSIADLKKLADQLF